MKSFRIHPNSGTVFLPVYNDNIQKMVSFVKYFTMFFVIINVVMYSLSIIHAFLS